MESRIAGYATRLNNLLRRLDRQNPANRVVRLQDRCSQLDSALKKSVQRLLENKNRQLQGQAQLLNSVSPLQTLTRGYSITFADDKPVLSSTEVSEGDEITTRLASGEIISKVTTVKKSL